jgi:DNA-binding MurR/RpiR family transcriptional regulator
MQPIAPSSSFADRVAERGPSLSPVSRRIAEHLLHAGPEVVLLSAAELADELRTSDASIIRTAKALGYRGLAELRRSISASTAGPGGDPSIEERLRRSLAEGAASESILHSLIANHIAALDGTARRIDAARFDAAVDLLAGGDRVLWCASGPSAAVADYAARLGSRRGRSSLVLRGSGTQLADELLGVRAGDGLGLLAYGRTNDRVRAVLDRCDAVGVPVVLITDAVAKDLRDRVALALPCGRGTPGLFSSHATTVVLVEALMLGLAARDPARAEASLAELNALRAAVAGRRRDVYVG